MTRLVDEYFKGLLLLLLSLSLILVGYCENQVRHNKEISLGGSFQEKKKHEFITCKQCPLEIGIPKRAVKGKTNVKQELARTITDRFL